MLHSMFYGHIPLATDAIDDLVTDNFAAVLLFAVPMILLKKGADIYVH